MSDIGRHSSHGSPTSKQSYYGNEQIVRSYAEWNRCADREVLLALPWGIEKRNFRGPVSLMSIFASIAIPKAVTPMPLERAVMDRVRFCGRWNKSQSASQEIFAIEVE
jgi:hypothetical protein